MPKSEEVKSAMVAVAYDHLKLSSLAVIINAVALSFALWSKIDPAILKAWLVASIVVSLSRYVSAYWFEKNPLRFDVVTWEKIFLFGVISTGLVWAAASVVLFTPENIMYQAILIIVLAGMSAGGVSSLSSVLPAVRVFLLLLLVPVIVRFVLEGTDLHTLTAVLLLLYLVLVMSVSNRFHRINAKAIESRLMFEKAKEQLGLSKERFETVFREAPAGIFLYDAELKILEVNQEFADLLEAPMDYLEGLDINTISDQRILEAIKIVTRKLDGFYEGEYHTHFSHKELYISMRTSPVLDARRDVVGGIGIVTDVTERMNDQYKIRHQAYYDALTDIPNRTMLLERIHQELIRFKRHKIISGILFLDLDHFKNINDSLGHHIGDEMLIETAQRLQRVLREEDTVARLGGDEFVILLCDLGEEPVQAIGRAEMVAQKVHRALQEPFHIQNHMLSTSSSIGVVVTDNENTTTEDMLKHADTAMYQAKRAGRGTTRFYRPELDRIIKRRLQIDNALRNAIINNELSLKFQPIVEFASNDIIGAEALLRWNHPELGEVQPDEFVRIAEESGMIIAIGDWVLRTACRQFVECKRDFSHACDLKKISVNVSSKQFAEIDFTDKVFWAIDESGIKPHELELELTESIIIHDTDEIVRKMRRLRDQGIGISIDDFGTGYSSLSYLKKLPFSTLKIDKSFTQDVETDEEDAELIRTITSIADNFELTVIAEGVETYHQHDFLLKNRCHSFQGYFCSPPLHKEAFGDFLIQTNGKCIAASTASTAAAAAAV